MSASGFVSATILNRSKDFLSDIAFNTSVTEIIVLGSIWRFRYIEVIIPYVTTLHCGYNIVT
jgi:hypothetical protein